MTLQDDVRNLASLPAFRELAPEALRLIAFSAETRILRTGDALFRKGDASDGGYVVRSGSFRIESVSGPATILRPPTLIGDLALLIESDRPATVLAREPSSVLRISRALFRRILSEYPDSAAQLRRAMAQRLVAMQQELNGLVSGGETPSS